MPWYAWFLTAMLAFNIPFQFYLVDRRRKPKTLGEAVATSVELLAYVLIVVHLGTHYVG